MQRFEELKRLDPKNRNKLRSILSDSEGNAIEKLAALRGRLSKTQSEALDAVLNSRFPGKATRVSSPFPKKPPFQDTLQLPSEVSLENILKRIEADVLIYSERLKEVSSSLMKIDTGFAARNIDFCIRHIIECIDRNGWSHALLRRIVLIRENLDDENEDSRIESLMKQANFKSIIVSSLVLSYSPDQSIPTAKRSILNLADRGTINRYSRAISRLPVQPFAASAEDFASFLSEVEKCSLIDAVILVKFNSHLVSFEKYPAISKFIETMGDPELFDQLVASYDCQDSENEHVFFKQSSAWLEYEPIRQYRILADHFYDASREEIGALPTSLSNVLDAWVGNASLSDLVSMKQFTKHEFSSLAKLELSGRVSRSAIFNFWLHSSEGQIGFEKNDLLTLMGLTRDLSRTVPIKAARTAAKLAKDNLVRLILLLLLSKRSKNELDSFVLRKLLEDIAIKDHDASLVKLVKFYERSHPYVAEYIYDIATEDFLAKLNKLAPHRADIPEIRASLHEWMADFAKDESYRQRARAVRIDHQLNRVRNEIDDHRIYVDPSRFSSWIEDEMMIELNSALSSTGSGKKGVTVNCDETVLSFVMTQCYNAFCANTVFGIASYIGRRIRHGTFHGHLYSSVVNSLESNPKFNLLFRSNLFLAKWTIWKDTYNARVDEIIRDRLHVQSKFKPLGLLQPEVYGPAKQEILNAAVKNMSAQYVESTSVLGIDQTIIDYCWRLAELDLLAVTRYLRAQQTPLKNIQFLKDEILSNVSDDDFKLAEVFIRDLEKAIDRKLTSMFGWFKRPSIVAPKASVSLLFDATVAEIKDTIPDFDPQVDDNSEGEINLVGGVYHLVYDSLAVVVANAAKHGDRRRPVQRKFEILPGKNKQLVVEISSYIKPNENPEDVSLTIERRRKADFHDANTYQGKSGIPKLRLLEHTRQDFQLSLYDVVGDQVKVRLIYALEH